MKKLLLASAIVITGFSQAHAQDRGADFYAGVYGGYGWGDAENANGADPSPSGTDYGIYGGFKADQLLSSEVSEGMTGALEAHWGGSTAGDRIGNVNIEKGREFGLSFRPGLSFLSNNGLNINPYGIVGYRNTQFETSVPGLKADDVYHGFEMGIGTELMVVEGMGIRADLSHTWYMEENDIDPNETNLRIGFGFHL